MSFWHPYLDRFAALNRSTLRWQRGRGHSSGLARSVRRVVILARSVAVAQRGEGRGT